LIPSHLGLVSSNIVCNRPRGGIKYLAIGLVAVGNSEPASPLLFLSACPFSLARPSCVKPKPPCRHTSFQASRVPFPPSSLSLFRVSRVVPYLSKAPSITVKAAKPLQVHGDRARPSSRPRTTSRVHRQVSRFILKPDRCAIAASSQTRVRLRAYHLSKSQVSSSRAASRVDVSPIRPRHYSCASYSLRRSRRITQSC
jgi:hypothetical protein